MAEQNFGDQAFGAAGSADFEPRRKSGEWGCMKTCGVGCLGVIVLMAIGGFILYRNSKFGTTEDPIEVAALIKETINADIPEGYDGKMSFNFSMFSYGTRMMMVGPKGVKLHNKKDKADDDKEEKDDEAQKHTMLIVFAIFGVDEETLKKGFQERQGGKGKGKEGPAEKTTLRVGNRDVPAQKVETSANGVKTIQYQCIVKPGVMFIAMGPADKFDQKAMEAFLASAKD